MDDEVPKSERPQFGGGERPAPARWMHSPIRRGSPGVRREAKIPIGAWRGMSVPSCVSRGVHTHGAGQDDGWGWRTEFAASASGHADFSSYRAICRSRWLEPSSTTNAHGTQNQPVFSAPIPVRSVDGSLVRLRFGVLDLGGTRARARWHLVLAVVARSACIRDGSSGGSPRYLERNESRPVEGLGSGPGLGFPRGVGRPDLPGDRDSRSAGRGSGPSGIRRSCR